VKANLELQPRAPKTPGLDGIWNLAELMTIEIKQVYPGSLN